MSLFGKLKEHPAVDSGAIKNELYKTNQEYRAMTDHFERENRDSEYIQAARQKYNETGDLLALISAYETIYIYSDKSNDPYATDYKPTELADLYTKAGMNDKAWGYLNSLVGLKSVPLEKVRFAQAKLLKKEKRHKDAIQFYLMGHVSKYGFSENVFIKDITPSANALKIKDRIPELKQIVTSSKSEQEVIAKYRTFCENNQIQEAH